MHLNDLKEAVRDIRKAKVAPVGEYYVMFMPPGIMPTPTPKERWKLNHRLERWKKREAAKVAPCP